MKNFVRLLAIMLAIGAVSQTVSTYGSDATKTDEAVQNWQEMRMNVQLLLQNKEFIRQVNWSAQSGNQQAQELILLLERFNNYETSVEPGP